MFNIGVVKLLAGVHGLSRAWSREDVVIDPGSGAVVDALIYGMHGSRGLRTIGVMHRWDKESGGVVARAVELREYVNYMYVVFSGLYDSHRIVRYLKKYGYLDTVLDVGVGVVYYVEGRPSVLFRSLFNRKPRYEPPVPLDYFMG